MKQPWIAAILSAILPGAGQMINHHWTKGALFLSLALIVSAMLRRRSILPSDFPDGSIWHALLVAVLFALAVWSAADAFLSRTRTPSH
jgi:hypothetical protein